MALVLDERDTVLHVFIADTYEDRFSMTCDQDILFLVDGNTILGED
jgi:hypothetical protein